MSGATRGTTDLTCNETLMPEDGDRPGILGVPSSANRRFTATNPHSQAFHRVNYPASGNTPPQKTYTAIARPVASRSYSVANTAPPRTVIGNSAYQAGPSGSSASGSGQRGFVTPNVTSRIRNPSLHDEAPTPHITFTTNSTAQPTIIRNPNRFIPPTPPPNPFVNSVRLTQAPLAPPSTGSKTAQGLLNVVQSMPRHTPSPSLNQFSSSAFGRSFSPSAAHRSSTNLLGTTSLHGPTNSFLGQVPTSPAIQRVQTSTPQSFMQSTSSGFVHPSPTVMGVHQNTVNTPSPRPSILRKPSTPGSAKRKLPFMNDAPGASSSGTSASPSISSVRSIIQNTNEASTSVAKALGSVGTSSNNGTEGESPRKRQRKQQFDNSQYEPMMMAVGVEPVKTPIWELPRDHPLAQEYFRNMHLPTEKKKRGRPRADASGKTGTPADQFMVQTGVRRVFVPMDQLPNQALSQIAQQQNQLLNPGMPAADAVAAAIQAAGLQNLQTQAVTSRYLGGTPLQNVNPKQTVKEVLMKAAAEQMRIQTQQKKPDESAHQLAPIAAVPTPKEPKPCPTPAPSSSHNFAIPDIPTTLKTPRQLAAEKKKAEAEALKAAKAAEIAAKAAAKSKARQAAAQAHGGYYSAPSTSKASTSKATASKAAAKPVATKGKKETAKKPVEVKPPPKPVVKKTAAQLKAEEEAKKRREAAKQKRLEKKMAAKQKKREEYQELKKKVKEQEKERMERKALTKKPVNFASWSLEEKTRYAVQLLARRYLRNIKEKALLEKDAKIQELGLTEKIFPEQYRQVQDEQPSVSKRVEVKDKEELQRPRMALWDKPAVLNDRYNHFKNIELLEKAYEDKQKALKVKNLAGWARNKLRKRCFRRATLLVNKTTKQLRKYYKKYDIPYEPLPNNNFLHKWLQWTLIHRVMDNAKKMKLPSLKNLKEIEKRRARLRRIERRKAVRLTRHRKHNRQAEEKRLKQFQADREKKLKAARTAGKTGEIEGVHYVVVSSKVTKLVDGKKKTIRIKMKHRIKQELEGLEKDAAVNNVSKKVIKKKTKIKKKESDGKPAAEKKIVKKKKKKRAKDVELIFPLVLMPLKKIFYTKAEFDKHVAENKMKYGGGPIREISLPEDPVLSIATSFSDTGDVGSEDMSLGEQTVKTEEAGHSVRKDKLEFRQDPKLIRATIPSLAAAQLQSIGQPRIVPQKLLKSNSVVGKKSSSLIGVKMPLEREQNCLVQEKKVNEPSACGMLPGTSTSKSHLVVTEANEAAVRALVESKEVHSQPTEENGKKLKKKKKKSKVETPAAVAKKISSSSQDSVKKVKKPKGSKEPRDKTACQIIDKEHKPTTEEKIAFLKAEVAKFNEKCAKLQENPGDLVDRERAPRSMPKYQNTYNYLWQKKMLRAAEAYDEELYGSKQNGEAKSAKAYPAKRELIKQYKKKALEELQPVSKKKTDILKAYPNLDPAIAKLIPDDPVEEEPVKKNRMRIWDPVAEQQEKMMKALKNKPFTLKDESIIEQAVDEMVCVVSYALDKDRFQKKLYNERSKLRHEYERPVFPMTHKEYHRLLLAQKSKHRQLSYSFENAFTDAFVEMKPKPEERSPLPTDCGATTAEIISSYHKSLDWWEAVCGPEKKRVKAGVTLTRRQKRERKRELRMRRLARSVRHADKLKIKQTGNKKTELLGAVPRGTEAAPKMLTATDLEVKLAKMRPRRKLIYIKKLRQKIAERRRALLKQTDSARYYEIKKRVRVLRQNNKKELNKLAPFRKKQTWQEVMDKKIEDFVDQSEAEWAAKRAAAKAAKELEAEIAKKAATKKKAGRPPKKKNRIQKTVPTPPPPMDPVVKVEEPEVDYKQFLRPVDREYTFADVFAELDKLNAEKRQKKKQENDSRSAEEPESDIKQEELEDRTAGGKKVKVTKGKPIPVKAVAKIPLPPTEPIKMPEPVKKKEAYKKKADSKKDLEVAKKESEDVKKEPAPTVNKTSNLKRKAEHAVAVESPKKKKGGNVAAPKEVKEEEPAAVTVVHSVKTKRKTNKKKKPAKPPKKWKPDPLVGTPSSRAAMWRYSRRGFIPMTVKDYNKQKKEARKQKRAEGIRRKEYRKYVRQMAAYKRRISERKTKQRLMAVSDNPIVRRQLLKSFQTKMRMEAKVRRILRRRKNEKIRERKQLKAKKLKECEEIAKAKGLSLKTVKRRMFRVRRQLYYQPTKRDIAIMRLEQLRRQFVEQMEMDRRLLVFFVDLLKVYDPAAYNKLQMDMARDHEPGDTPMMVKRKKWQRIRVTLQRPAAINLPLPKRPVLFESNDCVIINPSKTTVNQFMKVQSPFWKGPAVRWNKTNSRLDRKGNLMADRPDNWKPLDMTPTQIYKEDLVEWNAEQKLRQCEANMEIYWNQYCEEEGIGAGNEPVDLPPVLTSEPPTYGVNRRTIRFKQDKSEVVWVGGCDRPKLDLIDEDEGLMDDPEAKKYYYQAREMLATSSKHVHEQAVINFHILQKLIDDIVPKTPEQIAAMRAAAAAERKRIAAIVPPPPPPPPSKATKSSKYKKKGTAAKQPKAKPGKKAKKQQQAAAKAKKEAKKDPPKPRAPKHPRAPRTPVLTESTFERQMRRAIQESLRCMPSTSRARH